MGVFVCVAIAALAAISAARPEGFGDSTVKLDSTEKPESTKKPDSTVQPDSTVKPDSTKKTRLNCKARNNHHNSWVSCIVLLSCNSASVNATGSVIVLFSILLTDRPLYPINLMLDVLK